MYVSVNSIWLLEYLNVITLWSDNMSSLVVMLVILVGQLLYRWSMQKIRFFLIKVGLSLCIIRLLSMIKSCLKFFMDILLVLLIILLLWRVSMLLSPTKMKSLLSDKIFVHISIALEYLNSWLLYLSSSICIFLEIFHCL